jgi:hypothetical protein
MLALSSVDALGVSDGTVQESEGFNIESLKMDEITAVCLAPIRGQTSRSYSLL